MALIGIDDIAMYVPQLYLDMRSFAELRGLDYQKLSLGLGLNAMAIPDVHEDTATMGANAVSRLIDRNQIDPSKIGRIYLGTESALDGAKPTSTYIIDMLRQRYQEQYGKECFNRCDVVDMTFACIGAVDALHNTLDWVARGGEAEDRLGIVVFADNAKYDRGSTGEYTQGAGGGAVLIRHNPRLLAIPDIWGVSTAPMHDFYKPRRPLSKEKLLESIVKLANAAGAKLKPDMVPQMLTTLSERSDQDELFDEADISIFKDTPVFDGPLSNRCYTDRVKEAFIHFREQMMLSGRYSVSEDPVLTEQWKRIILHLPYAYQGKRMFPDIFRYDQRGTYEWERITQELGPEPQKSDYPDLAAYEAAKNDFRRKLSKTESFKRFVKVRIERGQRASSLIGNQYTGSIFLALMSTLESDLLEDNELTGCRFGFCGYGSGAKAKIFEGSIQPSWREIAKRFNLFERLQHRTEIDVEEYECLHRRLQVESIKKPSEEFILLNVEKDGEQVGQRSYAWIS